MSFTTFQEQSKGLEKEEHLQEDEKGGASKLHTRSNWTKKEKRMRFRTRFSVFQLSNHTINALLGKDIC